MHTLLKRLSIIQSAIALADAELIEMQSPLLRRFAEAHAGDEAGAFIDTLLADLAAGRFADAEQAITQFLQSQHQLVLHEDHEWAALQWEADTLSRQLADLQQQKEDHTALFDEFNRQYFACLGDKLARVLALREQLAYRTMQSAPNSEAQDTFRQAQQDYAQFRQDNAQQAQQPKPKTLDGGQQKRLKQAYRQASHLCHPDRVPDELKERAKQMFQELSEAYRQNDLEAVEQMLAQLQADGAFDADNRPKRDKEQLRRHISHLRGCIDALNNDIAALREDETYQLIESLAGDYAAYFADIAQSLDGEIAALEAELRQKQTA